METTKFEKPTYCSSNFESINAVTETLFSNEKRQYVPPDRDKLPPKPDYTPNYDCKQIDCNNLTRINTYEIEIENPEFTYHGTLNGMVVSKLAIELKERYKVVDVYISPQLAIGIQLGMYDIRIFKALEWLGVETRVVKMDNENMILFSIGGLHPGNVKGYFEII
jgi:hypothetical protein